MQILVLPDFQKPVNNILDDGKSLTFRDSFAFFEVGT